MSHDNREILNEAVAKKAAIIVSVRSNGTLLHFKSRFLGPARDGFWIHGLGGVDPQLIEELQRSQDPVAVSCRMGETKLTFVAPVGSHDVAYQTPDQPPCEALLLRFPADIHALQRRRAYRVRIPQYSDLKAQAWRIADYVDFTRKVPASAEVLFEMRDISSGGMGITLSLRDGKRQEIVNGQRLRLLMTWNEISLLIEARLRLPDRVDPAHPHRCGIVFKLSDRDAIGRQNISQLGRMVSELQREEARRTKLGLTG